MPNSTDASANVREDTVPFRGGSLQIKVEYQPSPNDARSRETIDEILTNLINAATELAGPMVPYLVGKKPAAQYQVAEAVTVNHATIRMELMTESTSGVSALTLFHAMLCDGMSKYAFAQLTVGPSFV